MTAYAVALEVSKVVTIITTLMMRVSLFPDWNRWRKTRNTGDMSVLPVQRAPSLKPQTTAMSAYAIAVTVSKVVTIITTVMMRISLLPDWNRWRKNHSTGEMSVMPFCWGVYGALVHNMFLLAPNIVGVSLSATQMIVTYMYRSKERISSSEDLQDADVLVISSDQDTEHDTSSCKNPDFVAMDSPRREDSALRRDLQRSSRQQ
ncbi:hypothetical protein PRIC2_011287 [Phytophthora ramorum]